MIETSFLEPDQYTPDSKGDTPNELEDVLSAIHIWVNTGGNSKETKTLIIGLLKNKGFVCTKAVENELFFKNNGKCLHIMLFENSQTNLPNDSQTDLCNYLKEIISKIEPPVVIDSINSINPINPNNSGNNGYYEKKITKRNTKGYQNAKYTKRAHTPKHSGCNFKKIK